MMETPKMDLMVSPGRDPDSDVADFPVDAQDLWKVAKVAMDVLKMRGLSTTQVLSQIAMALGVRSPEGAAGLASGPVDSFCETTMLPLMGVIAIRIADHSDKAQTYNRFVELLPGRNMPSA